MSGEIMKFQFGEESVRVHIDGEGVTWWVAADVCRALGIVNPRDAIQAIPDEEKNTVGISDGIRRGNPNVNVISEPGLYRLIFRSNKPAAREFTDWVVKEVLPSLRKTGSYAIPGKPAGIDPYARVRAMMDGLDIAEMVERRGLTMTDFKKFVCLCGKGLSSPEIGRVMGRTGRTIQRWRNDFSTFGFRFRAEDCPDPKCSHEYGRALLTAAGVELPARRAA